MSKFLAFLCGVTVGAVGMMIYVKKKVIPVLQEEIEKKVTEDEQVSLDEADDILSSNKYSDEIVINNQTPFKAAAEKKEVGSVEAARIDYSHFAASQGLSEEIRLPPPVLVGDRESDEYTTEIGGMDPYVIDANSYDEHSGYTAHAFEVYSDGVILDAEREEILDADPELVFGSTAMDMIKNGDDPIIYVRDDAHRSDYCLERIDYPFDGET